MPTKKSPARLAAAVARGRRYASVLDGSEYAAVNPATLRSWISDGFIRAYRVGRLIRVDLNEIDALMAGEAAI